MKVVNIAELLREGAENATSLQELERLTGLDSRRVRRAIQQERLQGVPILSEFGYYLPANLEERKKFCRQMRHRANEILEVVRSLEE